MADGDVILKTVNVMRDTEATVELVTPELLRQVKLDLLNNVARPMWSRRSRAEQGITADDLDAYNVDLAHQGIENMLEAVMAEPSKLWALILAAAQALDIPMPMVASGAEPGDVFGPWLDDVET